MKKMFLSTKAFLCLGLFGILAPSIVSCGSETDSATYIYVLNAEDYIDEELLTEFENLVKEEDGKDVKVIYETYDTNETMYNTLKTGKQTYDVLCCSDYMIQRLARENMLSSFDDAFDAGMLDNYKNYVSPFLAQYGANQNESDAKLNSISVEIPTGETDSDGNIIYDTSKSLADYAVGYMWGTLGVLYNPSLIVERNGDLFRKLPEYASLSDEELEKAIVESFKSVDGYSNLWAPEYNKTQSIKDSMRDTYAIGIFELYKDLFNPESPTYLPTYNERNEQFNKCDDTTIEGVQEELIKLKENIFGFEVDSGKDDIVTQKIAVNIAWSGDAVNSIGRGYYADDDWEEVRDEDSQVVLYYTVPKIGANIWFDAWCLPKHEDSYYTSDEYKYTIKFLDFLNDPYNAVANVSYNGYTSFIGSTRNDQNILTYTLYCYDLSTSVDDPDSLDTYDISYYFDFVDENGDPLTELTVYSYDQFEYDSYEDALADDACDEYVFTDEDGDGKLDIKIRTDLSSYEGRSLVAQYPETSNIPNLYVMRDFKNQNDKIVTMWENVKVNPLPVWVVVLLIVFLVGLFGYLGSYKLIKKYKVKKRKKLREELENN